MKNFVTAVTARVATLRAAARRRPRTFAAVAVLGLLLVLGGIGYGLYKKAEARTLDFAVARLNEAIVLRDELALAKFIDFRTFSQDFVRATSPWMPNPPTTDETFGERVDAIQWALLERLRRPPVKALTTEEEAKKAEEAAATEPRFDQVRPPVLLPETLFEQMAARPWRVQAQEGNLAVIGTEIEHAGWGGVLPLRLVIERQGDIWRVTRLGNAGELAQTYATALQDFRDHRVALFHAENAAIRERMNAYCYILSIDAKVANVKPDGTSLLLIRADGVNIGQGPLINAGLVCTITDAAGGEVARLPLNVPRQVQPGDNFVQQWNVEVSPPPDVLARLSRNSKLTCKWSLTAVTLGIGRFIFPKPESELMKAIHDFP